MNWMYWERTRDTTKWLVNNNSAASRAAFQSDETCEVQHLKFEWDQFTLQSGCKQRGSWASSAFENKVQKEVSYGQGGTRCGFSPTRVIGRGWVVCIGIYIEMGIALLCRHAQIRDMRNISSSFQMRPCDTAVVQTRPPTRVQFIQ